MTTSGLIQLIAIFQITSNSSVGPWKQFAIGIAMHRGIGSGTWISLRRALMEVTWFWQNVCRLGLIGRKRLCLLYIQYIQYIYMQDITWQTIPFWWSWCAFWNFSFWYIYICVCVWHEDIRPETNASSGCKIPLLVDDWFRDCTTLFILGIIMDHHHHHHHHHPWTGYPVLEVFSIVEWQMDMNSAQTSLSHWKTTRIIWPMTSLISHRPFPVKLN